MSRRRSKTNRRPRPLTGEVVKAPNFGAGAVVQTAAQITARSQGVASTYPLIAPRNQEYGTVPFAPGVPLLPSMINLPNSDGRPKPRLYEFPTAWNLDVTERRLVPFSILRDVADHVDLVRRCIEVIKSTVAGMQWDISLSPEAVERIVGESTGSDHVSATRKARESLMPDIIKAVDFWRMPDQQNGLSFHEWIACALEEVMVIDALAINPSYRMDGTLLGLEILDGSTIKPLLDDRGGRPLSPQPAYQQILYGFPRGEFTATDYSDDVLDGYDTDSLVYAVRNRRSWTPYGFSPVERCLPLADIYLKRQQWIRSEFTEGVVPELIIKTDANFGANPDLLRAYENVFNDALAGSTEQRKRARLLPEGMDPIQLRNWAEKYRPDFDEELVKDLCGHFGVLPSQIGHVAKGSIGGASHQEGEAQNAETLGLKPLLAWLTNQLNLLSHKFIGMPTDLSFKFVGGRSDAELEKARTRQTEAFSGQRTLNEIRTDLGLPMFEFQEADMPFVATGTTITFLENAVDMQTATTETAQAHAETAKNPPPPVVGVPISATPKPGQGSPPPSGGGAQGGAGGQIIQGVPRGSSVTPVKSAELKQFSSWLKKRSGASRPFAFHSIDDADANRLNALAAVDKDAALEYVDLLEGLVPSGR